MLHAVEVPASLRPEPAKPVLLECYTDPLCPHSAAFEAHWQRLQAEFGHRFERCYRLGGATATSHAAGQAVKCAAQQAPLAGELYLWALREAVLQHGRNPAQPGLLATVADELAARLPAVFDAAAFHRDQATRAGTAAFHADQQQIRHLQISRFPTLLLWQGARLHRVAVANQPYEVLLHALAGLAPDLFYLPCLVDGGAG